MGFTCEAIFFGAAGRTGLTLTVGNWEASLTRRLPQFLKQRIEIEGFGDHVQFPAGGSRPLGLGRSQ